MSDEPGSVRNRFRSDFIVEMVLMAALAVYFLLARDQVVGADLGFTVVGAVLMALATYWTLHTLKDGLQFLTLRLRPGK
ncbi:hypothetical protein [Marinobacter lutaoensis]|jgi:hypothetical protein|uniref:Chlorhexidine efflux transporter domain-containing protein n=1 Tax=Marinobacter lutaoensis TaxID=135739 RepID=A0A1V2DV89_9GAMM|nr:hypothetical protein [Marinobacter lutaoensis]MBE01556.1 hypothetical protein [Marinobacter sp.]MBI43364.1 hypothetical protein [Oceanospirillales bacterium]NVD34262.1 hypothetical protein [Marinobacter lutaoensis]ONF44409.1 hypothetical protein BTO32_05335 [Marinobacter lutaoensis]|tara:strand:+ start:161 stop:397 length:237 start_codon:yes stop_codon:yes gene_type:complete